MLASGPEARLLLCHRVPGVSLSASLKVTTLTLEGPRETSYLFTPFPLPLHPTKTLGLLGWLEWTLALTLWELQRDVITNLV